MWGARSEQAELRDQELDGCKCNPDCGRNRDADRGNHPDEKPDLDFKAIRFETLNPNNHLWGWVAAAELRSLGVFAD